MELAVYTHPDVHRHKYSANRKRGYNCQGERKKGRLLKKKKNGRPERMSEEKWRIRGILQLELSQVFESRAVEIIHKTDRTIGQLSDNETIPPSAHWIPLWNTTRLGESGIQPREYFLPSIFEKQITTVLITRTLIRRVSNVTCLCFPERSWPATACTVRLIFFYHSKSSGLPFFPPIFLFSAYKACFKWQRVITFI